MRPLVSLEFTAKDAMKAVQRRDAVIVIDVLRCCSTIVTALTNGAKGIIPTKIVVEARKLHEKHPEFVLAGERRGVKPRGFDLGNSPLEFSPKAIQGRCIILTTTSGTRAIALSKNAKWMLVGAFLNAEAVAKAALNVVEEEGVGISLVLSGSGGRFSLEDFLCAGLIIENLPIGKVERSDAALGSLLAFHQSRESLYKTVQNGYHAQYLKSIGFGKDVKFCCELNKYRIVPYLKGEMIIPLKIGKTFESGS